MTQSNCHYIQVGLYKRVWKKWTPKKTYTIQQNLSDMSEISHMQTSNHISKQLHITHKLLKKIDHTMNKAAI